jgi:hypothetical protein
MEIALYQSAKEVLTVLYTLALILLILWALGMVTSYTVGGLIHILLVLAIISVLIRVIQGRPV